MDDAETMMIEIDQHLHIPEEELSFVASRSSGPGGQHVNKVSTRMTLRFDVEASPSLDQDQKAKVRQRLATRMTKDGVLLVHAQKHRSQSRNRLRAVERFVELLRGALAEAPPRRPTRKSVRARARRLEAKRQRGQVKALRRPPTRDD